MLLRYLIDIDQKSFSCNYTPSAPDLYPLTVHAAGYYYANKDYFTEREGLDNFLLIYTLGGRGYLKYKNNEHILLPGHAVVFSCRDYHLYKTCSDEQWVFQWTHFSGPSAANYAELINGDGLAVVESREAGRRIEYIIGHIKEHSILQDALVCAELVNGLTALLSSRHQAGKSAELNRYQAELSSVAGRICARYREKLTLDDLIREIPLSKFYFMRLFKAYTGLNPYEYLTRHRINEAKKLLRTTNLSVSDIAYATGFNDPNNFIRAFKKLAGTTPLYFRKYWTV